MQRVAPEIRLGLASLPEGLNGEAVALETKTAQHKVRANASNLDTTASSIKLQKS